MRLLYRRTSSKAKGTIVLVSHPIVLRHRTESSDILRPPFGKHFGIVAGVVREMGARSPLYEDWPRQPPRRQRFRSGHQNVTLESFPIILIVRSLIRSLPGMSLSEYQSMSSDLICFKQLSYTDDWAPKKSMDCMAVAPKILQLSGVAPHPSEEYAIPTEKLK